ncbi:MAG TPA: helix-turn-helix domain-containing protein [Planctomycetota bacterium]|jgi:AcrR family transcriptional regulator|nr:helix-turn-helix domain-containing protein [Planctomycetota bacterium]
MSPRAYDRTLRLAAAEEAKRRITEAAAALHARQGAVATSHAMIAQKAGVSIPTVYKYFPSTDDLIPACTGLVAGKAPLVLGEGIFDGIADVPGRLRALARALFRIHEYFAPWLRWCDTDAAAFPSLQKFLEEGRLARLQLLRRALSPRGTRPPAEAELLMAHILLEYPSWKILCSAGKTSDQAAADAADGVLRLLGSRPHERRNP